MKSPVRWDIFCQVVDNYGDIGVCWRLARQLAAEHGLTVRLWVDDLHSLQRIFPDTDPTTGIQQHIGVDIRQWSTPFPPTEAAEVVIEAFGCALPESYLAAMAGSSSRPVWINLEYLSAEAWVEGCHALPSPHPQYPLTKHFFFPGFTPATGGLLRESGLISRRDGLLENPEQLWQQLNLAPPGPDETTVSLFCYDNAPIDDLISAWEKTSLPVRCLIPEGKPLTRASAHFGKVLDPGDTLIRGNLRLQAIPFLRQEDYDLLLWACDCNFVRGEDSFVRAQWAARPMIWQIYVQEENAHLVKLDAFLDRYCRDMAPETATVLRKFHHGWNRHGVLDWPALQAALTDLRTHAVRWSEVLSGQPDLASNLVIFCKNPV